MGYVRIDILDLVIVEFVVKGSVNALEEAAAAVELYAGIDGVVAGADIGVGLVVGIVTDGDLRRMFEKGIDVYSETVDNVMTNSPKFINEKEMAVNALQRMTDLRITGMPVLDSDNKVVGTILMQDIYKAGILK